MIFLFSIATENFKKNPRKKLYTLKLKHSYTELKTHIY